MTREEAYDSNISPLMTQIVAICKEHGIPMVASFQLNDERPADDAFCCTTILVGGKDFADTCEALSAASSALRPRRSPMMMLTSRDAEGNVTRMETIVG